MMNEERRKKSGEQSFIKISIDSFWLIAGQGFYLKRKSILGWEPSFAWSFPYKGQGIQFRIL